MSDRSVRKDLPLALVVGARAQLRAAELAEEGIAAQAVQCDVTDGQSVAALARMCRRLAPAFGAAGNRIVSLSPGLIATPMGEREFAASPQKAGLLERTPLGRQGGLHEICDALEFLCSERASFITGTDLLVDGGITGLLSL